MPPLSERAKKILLLVLFLAVVAGIITALYFTFFQTPATTPIVVPPGNTGTGSLPGSGTARPPTSTTPGTTGNLPTGGTIPGTNPGGGTVAGPDAASSRTETLVDSPTQFINAGGQAGSTSLRFYNSADGKFYRVDAQGNLTPLSDQPFYNVQSVSWGNTSDKAVLEFPDGSNVLYDFKQSRQITLPKYWEDFGFAPNDEQIIAKSVGNNESNRFLVIANPDGSNAEAIQELGNNADKVSTVWAPNNQVVAYAHTGDPIGFDREQIVLIGKNRENLPGLITEGRGFIPSWSPSGSSLLYSVYTSANGYLPELWVTDGGAQTINDRRRRLELNTWADKCSWGSDQLLICAVPRSLETGAALQREGSRKGPDQIYQINVKTGQKTNLGQADGITEVRSITVAADGKSAYLLDQSTGHIATFNLQP